MALWHTSCFYRHHSVVMQLGRSGGVFTTPVGSDKGKSYLIRPASCDHQDVKVLSCPLVTL